MEEEPSLFKSLIQPIVEPRFSQVVQVRRAYTLDNSASANPVLTEGAEDHPTLRASMFCNQFAEDDNPPSVISDSLPTLKYNHCEAMEFTCNGKFLATSHNRGIINMWHSEDLTLHDNLSTSSNVTQMVAAPNHYLLAVCDANSGLVVYNTRRMRLEKTFYHSTKPISCMGFSP